MSAPSPIVVTHHFTCDATPEALWPIAGDTESLNRIAGMAPVVIAPNEDASSARLRGRTTLDGLPIAYLEEPSRWEYPRWFTLHRDFQGAPVRTLEMTVSLEPIDGGTSVTLTLTMVPVSAVVGPVMRMMGQRRIDAMGRAILTLREMRQAEAAAEVPAGETEAEKLTSWLAGAEAHELTRIRPFALADGWGADRRAVLRSCLEGVCDGQLVMQWDLVCPSCRTGAESVASLAELDETGHCQICDLRFDLSMDQSVEAVFSTSGASGERYCAAGPAQVAHVLVQDILPPEGQVALAMPSEPGRYRLFVRGGVQAEVRVSAGGLPAASLRAVPGGIAEPAPLAPGGVLTLHSGFDVTLHVKLERTAWRTEAATAYDVSLEPAFQKMFSLDVLSPGTRLSVGRVTLMFTDLTDSTPLYERLGDAAAYKLVRAHFGLLQEAIEAEGGAVVKTIGDAVMASFPSSEAALAAAAACQGAWPGFLDALGYPDETRLRIGIHSGPCYAVQANGVLDYFGQAVNIAARVEAAAEGGEIAMTRATLGDLGELPAGLEVLETRMVKLKGLSEHTELIWLGRKRATELRLAA